MAVLRHTPLVGVPLVDLGLPVGPLHGLVRCGAGVYHVNIVQKQAPDERGGEHGQYGDGAHADIVLHAPGPDDEVGRPVIALGRGRPDGEIRVTGGHLGAEEGQAKVRAVCGEEGRAEEEQDEPLEVALADAAIDKDAVVVRPRDTVLAYGAVLGPGGLQEPAGAAVGARVEQGVVIRVLCHLLLVVLRRDVARVRHDGEVEEEIGADDGDAGYGLLERAELWPDGR